MPITSDGRGATASVVRTVALLALDDIDVIAARDAGTRLVLDFDSSRSYIVIVTKLLDEALEAVRRLPSRDQDDIARAIMQLAGSDLPAPVSLSPQEREAVVRSKAAAGRGEFATDEQVRAVWAKHGL